MQNQRKNYFIDKNFQTKFILKFCLIVILASIAIGVSLFILSANSTTVAIANTKITVKTTADFILPFIIQTILLVTLFSAISVILLTLFISHRIAGPLFRLKREIDKLTDGDLAVNFQIRSTDQLKNLSVSLTSMSHFLKNNLAEIKNDVNDAKNALQPLTDKRIEEKIKKIESTLSRFKNL